MATEDLSLASRLEKAINSVDSVMRGLQEIAPNTALQHALWAFSNALEAAQPALDDAFSLIEKAEVVAHG